MVFRNILAPIDFSEPSTRALACARVLANKYKAALFLLHVVRDTRDVWGTDADRFRSLADEIERAARDRLDGLLVAESGERMITRIGQPHDEILGYAKTHDIDLIVMGTHGYGRIEHLVLGSVAERVVRAAPCPVMTVRGGSAT